MMKKLIIVTMWLGLLAPLPAAADCRFGDPVDVEDIPHQMLPLIEETAYASLDELQQTTGEVTATAYDLNGDGRSELCVAFETMQTCSLGNVVCLHLVLDTGGAGTVLLEDTPHWLELGDGADEGWQRLVSVTNTGDGERRTPLIFDGTAYEQAE